MVLSHDKDQLQRGQVARMDILKGTVWQDEKFERDRLTGWC